MTPSFLLPVALFAAPPQMSPAEVEAAPLASAPAAARAEIPVIVSVASTDASDAVTQSTDSDPANPAGTTPPELADPLVDPATQLHVEAPSKAARHYPGDPLEGFNRTMFGIQLGLDKSIYRPLAMGYQHILPKPARSGLRNFFRNLSEPAVFVNDLLQLKLGRAARTLARFTINSTIGLGGLIDVAASKGVNLPHRDNSFGNTLAYYGVHPGSYLFLPLVGPTTLRDFLGGPVDGAVLPLAVGKPFTEWRYKIVSTVITGLDLRAESDPELRALFAGAVDPYATLRSVWLQNRAAEVSKLHHHGKTQEPAPELEDPLRDPASSSPAPLGSAVHEPQDSIANPVVAPVPN